MASKTKTPTKPQQKPFYVTIKQLGLALKEGWSWLLIPAFKYLYPLIFIIFLIFSIKFFGLDQTVIIGLLSSMGNFVLKYISRIK